ncbi:hypothetical protein [Mangrovicella endophytica]|uniref:hypothetical protein n=1 Tax=Mangrovicella endophytica TaxID=2066697 RepID=UPI000C9E45C6|nr:hypothetical protein [Mangrovicella endophytica]
MNAAERIEAVAASAQTGNWVAAAFMRGTMLGRRAKGKPPSAGFVSAGGIGGCIREKPFALR